MQHPSHIRRESVFAGAAVAAVLLSGLTACSPSGGQATAATGGGQDADAIRTIETRWNQDWKDRSLEPLVGYYAHDAVLMAPGAKPANGSDAIRAALTDILSDPKFTLTFSADKVAVAASGDLAYTAGTYSETATNPKTHAVDHENGTYVTVYRKAADGAWKAVADINTPGPAAS